MKILLLGARGLFGTEFELACQHRNIDVVSTSRKELDLCDLENIEEIVTAISPTVIVNSTGIVDINKCEDEPENAFHVHVKAVERLARICEEMSAVLVQTSTHLVFDGTMTVPYSEMSLVNPNSYYAATKFIGETLAARSCSRTYVVRFPTLYGHRRNESQDFVHKLRAWMQDRDKLKIADDRIDTVTYAADAATCLVNILMAKREFGTYHIANAGPHSYFEFAEELNKLLNYPAVIIRAKDADFPLLIPKPLRVPIASNKLEPLRSWQSALSEFVKSNGSYF
jgi:dTDP-4-dehydrorhamnose reductase